MVFEESTVVIEHVLSCTLYDGGGQHSPESLKGFALPHYTEACDVK